MKAKKHGMFLLMMLTGITLLAGCASKPEQNAETGDTEAPVEEITERENEDMDGYPVTINTEGVGQDAYAEFDGLPAYVYEGDAKIAAICDYLITDIAASYSEADVSIPYMKIIDTDDSDPDDTKVWGDFRVINYDLNGDVLEMASGGNYPGLMHLRKVDDSSYTVTDFEMVEDGSNYLPSAQRIFGERYEAFAAAQADDEEMEKIRAEFIKDYVETNGLNITAYQDYGWDPVQLGDIGATDDVHEPMDITGCNTFTQIVDKLSAGQGYANVNLVHQDVLLVSSGTYDLDVDKGERFGAIDAEVYMYAEDGSILYLGFVQAGGTAYPLAMDADRHLCVGSNHSMAKMTIADDERIAVDEEVYVVYDSDGNETYYHVSDVAVVEQDPEGKLSDDSLFQLFFENYANAEVILFDTVK